MDEREQLLIWTEVMERLRATAELLLLLPESEEVEAIMAELEGCSMGWTREEPGAPPLAFDRVNAQVVALERHVLDAGRPSAS